jgi:hypothetical protein
LIGWGAILGFLAGAVIGFRIYVRHQESGIGNQESEMGHFLPVPDSRFPTPDVALINRVMRTPLAGPPRTARPASADAYHIDAEAGHDGACLHRVDHRLQRQLYGERRRVARRQL